MRRSQQIRKNLIQLLASSLEKNECSFGAFLLEQIALRQKLHQVEVAIAGLRYRDKE
jgi:hypothetical protein